MSKYIVLLLVLLLSSCANSMLIKYQVNSEEGTFEILYDDNIPEVGDTLWEKESFTDGSVSIYVKPLEQSQTLDVRVFYETANSSGTYKRVVSQKAILINDKVRVR